jgi:hypothetical protein
MDIKEIFEKYENESYKFELVQNKLSQRGDMHAMIMLDQLFPGGYGMVSAAEHDQIWFNVSWEDVNKLTEEQIRTLNQCGVWFDHKYQSLSMFV